MLGNHRLRVRSIAPAIAVAMVWSVLGIGAVDAAGEAWFYDAGFAGSEADDLFGAAVAVDGDTVVVGVPWSPATTRRGAVHVFTRTSGTGRWDLSQILTDPGGRDGDHFGWSVDIDGDRIVVGARRDDGVAQNAGAVHVFARNPATGMWAHTQEILPPPGTSALTGMGEVVSIDGNVIVAGAADAEGAAGAVYVFVPGPRTAFINEIRTGNIGIDTDEYFELVGPPGGSLDGLTYLVIGDGTGGSGVVEEVVDLAGRSLGADGLFVAAEAALTLGSADFVTDLNFEDTDNVTHLLVRGFTGSDGDDLDADDDGVLDTMPWSEVVDLVALVVEENPPLETEFHYGPPSVGPDGSFVPVHVYRCGAKWRIGYFSSSFGDDTLGAENDCGAEPATVWELDARLTEPVPAKGSSFGDSVAVDASEGRIVVGAPGAAGGGTQRGAIVVFAGGPGAWDDEFTMAGAADLDALGTSVDIEGRYLIAGASGADKRQGAAYVLRRKVVISRIPWEIVDELADPVGAPDDLFGTSAAMDGGTIVIGARLDDGAGKDRGALHLFRPVPATSTWSFEEVLVDPRPADDQQLGWSVAIDGGRVVGGTFARTAIGGAHVFGPPDPTPPVVTIASPEDGARLAQGVPAVADFSCSDGGSGLGSCVGAVSDGSSSVPVADGGPIDTSALGSFTLSVRGTDRAGNTTTVSHSYAVVAACDGKPVTHVVSPGGAEFPGSAGDDVILGTDGPDVIKGLGGNDTICGGGGDDVILGGPGDDTLLGGEGNDKLRGAAGDDVLRGGGGSDRLLPEAGFDVADGGPGSDIVDYLAAAGPVTVDLVAGTAVYRPVGGSEWSQVMVAVEKVDGSVYGDVLIGDGKRNVLRGKQGDDTISGGGGDDDLIGGTGDDEVRGGDGDDLVKGQANDDLLYGDGGADKLVGGSGSDRLSGGDGDDTLVGGLQSHLGVFVNILDGGAGTDTCRWDTPTTNCEP